MKFISHRLLNLMQSNRGVPALDSDAGAGCKYDGDPATGLGKTAVALLVAASVFIMKGAGY